jgi:predicted Holliday junction resolvase-like endonuclease
MLVGLFIGIGIGAGICLLYFVVWRARYLQRVRQEAVQKSQAVITGRVYPKDARFLGSPVDLVIFDGLDSGRLERVVFVEVKTGTAGLSNRERQLRATIQARRVEWLDLRLPR